MCKLYAMKSVCSVTDNRLCMLLLSGPQRDLTSWRRQLDHIFMQLKAYARKKEDTHAARFQAEAMEFVMGEVTSASIRQDGDEVCLTVSLVDMALTPHRTKVFCCDGYVIEHTEARNYFAYAEFHKSKDRSFSTLRCIHRCDSVADW